MHMRSKCTLRDHKCFSHSTRAIATTDNSRSFWQFDVWSNEMDLLVEKSLEIQKNDVGYYWSVKAHFQFVRCQSEWLFWVLKIKLKVSWQCSCCWPSFLSLSLRCEVICLNRSPIKRGNLVYPPTVNRLPSVHSYYMCWFSFLLTAVCCVFLYSSLKILLKFTNKYFSSRPHYRYD